MPRKSTSKKTRAKKTRARASAAGKKATAWPKGTKATSRPKGRTKARATNRGLNAAAVRRGRSQPATGKPQRKDEAAPRPARGREPFRFQRVNRPTPEVEALLVKVYQHAAQELREQEERARSGPQPDSPERADMYAEARRQLIDAIVLWEQKRGEAR